MYKMKVLIIAFKLKNLKKKMSFYKECVIQDATDKYGFANLGVFAQELIKKGELVFKCDPYLCDYKNAGKFIEGKTMQQALAIIDEHPHLNEFIRRYSCMIDDDTYIWPKFYMEKRLVCDCMFINHSCEPNTGFQDTDIAIVRAIKDIQPGEEVTIDYQYFDTEHSFYDGIDCKCGHSTCRGRLRLDAYRNVDWQKKYYQWSGIYDQVDYIAKSRVY